jgi:hypothetical protein
LVQKAVNEAKTDPALLEEQKESEIWLLQAQRLPVRTVA